MSEQLTPEADRLVRAGRDGLSPSAEDIDRLRGRILAGVAAGVALTAGGAGAAAASTGGAAAATGSAASAGGIGLVKLVVVAAAVTGATVTGGVMISRRPEPAKVATARPAATDEGTTPSRRVARQPAVEPLPDPAPDAAPVAAPAPVPRIAPPAHDTAQPRPSLASEMDLLRRARAALRAGDAHGALEHLDRHADEFPASALAPEAAVIRIEATCAVGDRETAQVLVDQFVRRWPGSPLARRVSHLCGGGK